jgi:hypothetical protein
MKLFINNIKLNKGIGDDIELIGGICKFQRTLIETKEMQTKPFVDCISNIRIEDDFEGHFRKMFRCFEHIWKEILDDVMNKTYGLNYR